MNTKSYIGLLVLVLAIGGFVVWGNQPTSSTNDAHIKVGVIGILSGEYAAVGENIQHGIILAQEEWNASGNGPKIDLVSEDDGFDAKKGVSAYQKLMSVDRVDALINTSSPTIDAIYKDVTKQNFPEIQFGNQGVDPTDDNVIQVTPGNAPLEIALGKLVKEKYPADVAVFYGGDAVFMKFFQDFKRGYGEGLTEYVTNQVSDDPRQTAAKIAAQNPKAVVIIAAPTSGARLVAELKKVEKGSIEYFFDVNFQSGLADYTRIVGAAPLEGVIAMVMVPTENAGFVSAYEKRWGGKPGFWAEYGYDGFMTLARGYDADGAKWITKVKQTDFAGASGRITFDETGVLNPAFKAQQLKSGALSDL